MKWRVRLWHICVYLFSVGYQVQAQEIDQTVSAEYFDELLEKTPYAQLLKEFICLTDTIGLLCRRMRPDEYRFIIDNILGKSVRISDMIESVDFAKLDDDSVAYLLYWASIATEQDLPEIAQRYLEGIKQQLEKKIYGLALDAAHSI